MFKDSLSRVVKTWNRMSLIQKVFIVVALVTVLCSICTDCLLCKHWPVKVPMSASMAPSVSASMRSVSQSAENFQNPEAGAAKIVLYYVPWCPHCKNVMPEWNKLEQEAGNTGVSVEKVDCEQQPEEAQKQDVEGFPTIILFKDGKVINYEGERTADALKQFISSN